MIFIIQHEIKMFSSSYTVILREYGIYATPEKRLKMSSRDKTRLGYNGVGVCSDTKIS